MLNAQYCNNIKIVFGKRIMKLRFIIRGRIQFCYLMEVHFDHGLNVFKSPFNNPILLYTYCSGQINKASYTLLRTCFIEIEIVCWTAAICYCDMTYIKLSCVRVIFNITVIQHTMPFIMNASSDFQFPFPCAYSFFIFEMDMDINDVD